MSERGKEKGSEGGRVEKRKLGNEKWMDELSRIEVEIVDEEEVI